jgi:hypothetical protein
MSESECPALNDSRRELQSVMIELEVWRGQEDPCLVDKYGVPMPSPSIRVADLEDEQRELLANIAYLEGRFCYTR